MSTYQQGGALDSGAHAEVLADQGHLDWMVT